MTEQEFLELDTGDVVRVGSRTLKCIGAVKYKQSRYPIIEVPMGHHVSLSLLPPDVSDQVSRLMLDSGVLYANLMVPSDCPNTLLISKALKVSEVKAEVRGEDGLPDLGRWLSGVDKYKNAARDPKTPFRWL